MRPKEMSGWLRAPAVAGGASVPMSTTFYPRVAAQLMRAVETAHCL